MLLVPLHRAAAHLTRSMDADHVGMMQYIARVGLVNIDHTTLRIARDGSSGTRWAGIEGLQWTAGAFDRIRDAFA
jgi:hypothetical protein